MAHNPRNRARGASSPTAPHNFVYGTIVGVDPVKYTCSVDTDDGSTVQAPFPNLTQDAQGCGGSVSVPQTGQRVLLHLNRGNALVVQSAPIHYDAGLSDVSTPSATEVPISARAHTSSSVNFRGNMPKDLLEGDQMTVGPRGEMIGVLARSGVLLSASKNAEVRATGAPVDGLAVRGRKLTLSSDFGEMEFQSNAGKSAFSLLGGTDQTLETGRDRQNWTTRISIGDGGDTARVGFYDRDGLVLNERVIETDGGEIHEIAGRESRLVQGDVRHEIGGSRTVVIPEGNDTRDVSGAQEILVGSNYGRDVGQNLSSYVKNDRSDNINRDWTASVGRTAGLSVGGDLLATAGAAAYTQSISNGSYIVDIGMPSTERSAALSSYKLTVYPTGGSIEMKSVLDKIALTAPAGNIEFLTGADIQGTCTNLDIAAASEGKLLAGAKMDITSIGDTILNAPKVLLAATNGVAANYAVLWNELNIFLTKFAAAFDSHQHPTAAPFSPTLVPIPSPAAGPISVAWVADGIGCRSKKVGIGG